MKVQKKIENQKKVAKIIFESLTKVDPHCILAGGALRDWNFGNECKDLDFYFASTANTINAVREQLIRSGIPDNLQHNSCRDFNEEDSIYSRMDGIQRIYNLTLMGEKVQLIQMITTTDRWNAVRNMDVSICQIYCNSSFKPVKSTNFLLTELSKVMFLNEDKKDPPTWYEYHPNKMKERFNGKFYIGTKRGAEIAILNDIINHFDHSEMSRKEFWRLAKLHFIPE